MFKFYHILGFIWVLPISIIGWVFMAVLSILGQVERLSFYPDLTFVWDLKNKGFFVNAVMGKWFGFTIGNNIIVVDVGDSEVNRRCFLHERRHTMQQYICGVFFYLIYVLESLRIYVFCKDEHAYLDNGFEVDARKYAGQPEKIHKSQWPDGPNDRWPWW
jgi:hypothetical protein